MNDTKLKTFFFVFDLKHYVMLMKLRDYMRMNSNEIIEKMIERLYNEQFKIQE